MGQKEDIKSAMSSPLFVAYSGRPFCLLHLCLPIMGQREDEFDVELMMESQFRPLWALPFFSFWCSVCALLTLNWVSKGFWCYDCLTLQITLSYHQ
jgi:hypothetical protein